MARGLSLLQRQILCKALDEKIVLCQDLLFLWGVKPGPVVDKGIYAAAHSALSRSLTRLFWRGLIEYWQHKLTRSGTAITLTHEGEVLARSILAEDHKDQFND